MVTKLDDGEQLEIEEKARNAAAGGQDLVILLESGRSEGWDRALHLCDPVANITGLSCSFSPLCQYVETMLGTPPPISRPKFTLTESSLASTDESLAFSVTDDLEPSFTTSVSKVQTSDTLSHAETKETTSDDVHVQSSSESARGQTSVSSSEATTQIPDQVPAESDPGSASAVPIEQDKSSEGDTVREKGMKTVGSDSTMDTVASVVSSIPVKEKPVMGTDRKMVETDPGTTVTSATGVSADDLLTTQPADPDADIRQSEAEPTQDKLPVNAAAELLEPSVQLDKTAVSPTLTRPTPVLEMAGASVGGAGSKGEVLETVMPCLSPSPTSETADAAEGQLDSAAFPQIIQPTVEVRHPCFVLLKKRL